MPLANIQVRSRGELVGREYVNWWLLYLLLITCVPFTTVIIGRFGTLAPAIWLYAGNTALIALVAFRLMALTPDIERDHHLRARQVQLILLIVSSLLAIALSFVTPWDAMDHVPQLWRPGADPVEVPIELSDAACVRRRRRLRRPEHNCFRPNRLML